MSKYIDAEKLFDYVADNYDGDGSAFRQTVKILSRIKATPTADADARGYGVWLDATDTSGGDFYRCSKCGTYIEKTFFANDYKVNFCPNCGAQMDGGMAEYGEKTYLEDEDVKDVYDVTDDVAEVVRCKNCQHGGEGPNNMVYCPKFSGGLVPEDSFCTVWKEKNV